MPPDSPDGRVLLIRHLTRDRLWQPAHTFHANHAVALTEAVYATASPAETMARLSLLSGRPAEPDPLGGYRVVLARGCLRFLPLAAAAGLFPGTVGQPRLIGLTIAIDSGGEPGRFVQAGGVAIRFVPTRP